MKTIKENSPLKDVCPDKKLTNHKARKTVVKKLKSSGIPKCEIKSITGHSSEQGLDDYDSGDENEQRIMSNIIDNATNARQVLQPLSSQLQVKSTISAIAIRRSTSLKAILHYQVSVRASEATRGSFCQILTLITVNRGEWLSNSSKFFVVCYCSVFWPWPCTKHNSCYSKLKN